MIGVTRLRQLAFGISPRETSFERRGFVAGDPDVQRHLESAGRAFVSGYNTALAKPQADVLAAELDKIEAIYRGFAFEGAAMAPALVDRAMPWNRGRWQAYVDSPAGDAHVYMVHVGLGWAIARIPWSRRNFEQSTFRYHPLYRWLALDGYGFHQGYFHAARHVEAQIVPRGLSVAAARVFDQGLGRSMWFSRCADSGRIAESIAAFPASRRGDLWSGVGLAATYAGGVNGDVLDELRKASGPYSTHVAQGAAFAAKARLRAGNMVSHTELACNVFCDRSANAAAAITDDCLRDLPADGVAPAYLVWREQIQQSFANSPMPASQQPKNAAAVIDVNMR